MKKSGDEIKRRNVLFSLFNRQNILSDSSGRESIELIVLMSIPVRVVQFDQVGSMSL